jgi:DNA repair exonuclease SbcCD ATPase subunit
MSTWEMGKMISQRDINQFFNIVDILSNPEKVRQELLVLENIRKDIDEREARVLAKEEQVNGRRIEADRIIDSQNEVARVQAMTQNELDRRAQMLAEQEQKILKVLEQQRESARILQEEEKRLKEWDAAYGKSLEEFQQKEADYASRMSMLREKEKDYQERMEKLRKLV